MGKATREAESGGGAEDAEGAGGEGDDTYRMGLHAEPTVVVPVSVPTVVTVLAPGEERLLLELSEALAFTLDPEGTIRVPF
jgi:hypothetical protein